MKVKKKYRFHKLLGIGLAISGAILVIWGFICSEFGLGAIMVLGGLLALGFAYLINEVRNEKVGNNRAPRRRAKLKRSFWD